MATVKSDSQTEAAGADHQEAEGRALHALLASAKAGITVRDEFRHLLKFLPEGSVDFDDIRNRLLAARVCSFADVQDVPFPDVISFFQHLEGNQPTELLSRATGSIHAAKRTQDDWLTGCMVHTKVRSHERQAERMGVERSVYFSLKRGERVSRATLFKASKYITEKYMPCTVDDLTDVNRPIPT